MSEAQMAPSYTIEAFYFIGYLTLLFLISFNHYELTMYEPNVQI